MRVLHTTQDKSTVSFDSTEPGFIAKILVEEGAGEVPVGQLLAVMVEDAEDIAAFADFSAPEVAAPTSPAAAPTPEPTPAPTTPAPTPTPAVSAPAPPSPPSPAVTASSAAPAATATVTAPVLPRCACVSLLSVELCAFASAFTAPKWYLVTSSDEAQMMMFQRFRAHVSTSPFSSRFVHGGVGWPRLFFFFFFCLAHLCARLCGCMGGFAMCMWLSGSSNNRNAT